MGSILCTVVVVVPSFILTIKASHYIKKHREEPFVAGMMKGMRPVVVGLIASAALLLMNSANFGTETRDVICSIAICAGSFSLVFWAKLHPIIVIVIAGAVGFFIF